MSKNPKTQERPQFERRALSIEEAARTCGLSRATLYRLIADGKLTTLKIGARRVVPVGAIDALFERGRGMKANENWVLRSNAGNRAETKSERKQKATAVELEAGLGPA